MLMTVSFYRSCLDQNVNTRLLKQLYNFFIISFLQPLHSSSYLRFSGFFLHFEISLGNLTKEIIILKIHKINCSKVVAAVTTVLLK